MYINIYEVLFLLNYTFVIQQFFTIEINSTSAIFWQTPEKPPGEPWLPFWNILHYIVGVTYYFHLQMTGFNYTDLIMSNANQTLYVWM
jgi:hypothetical protein